MADRNEADALFATKRKKQQEEQAEQERREEMSRKKAEMEAEIRRLEEEARRQKEKQEEDRRQAEEEARRVKQEAEEAEARAKRAREMEEEARRKQEEVKREEERRAREKREEGKRARERMVQERAQAKQEEAQRAEERKREAKERAAEKKAAKEAAKAETRNGAKEKTVRSGGEKADIQPGKKLPVLPLAIGGVVVAAVLVICLVLFSGGKKGGVFGTDCDLMAAKQVLGYDVFYPESFEEAYSDGGVYLKYGSVENGDFSFVYVLGSTQDDMNYMTESTDPTDLIHVMEEYVFGMNDKQVYKMTTGSGRAVYCSEYISFDISSITDQEEGVMASASMMMLPLDGEYLVAVYATMKPSYEEALEEVTASILDNTY